MRWKDEHIRNILAVLREDARMKSNKMARLLRMPQSTLHDRMKSHVSPYVDKSTVLLNFSKLGLSSRAHVVVKLEKGAKEEGISYLVKHPNVNTVQRINNGFDLLFEVVFPQLRDMERFFDDLENKFKIKTRMVHYIIEDYKREGFMAGIDSLKMIDFL
ncbi:winged helix-turn-helix transcriptional regulator [Candidatus Woesearchaeota archaeon]|nr:MAG: hypothetical protein QS99_C0014G0027 [archaeon GW2011_AR4]MBS3130730.1 winged helix-turn-helix transcriptional regulator [Candidatus Woesearchaeota archaeon]HIH38405.1 winged helix-turn-helix transcriptional regulator [Candidatus Woesearchaeota archaeon]HIH49044.1 winged helix-turn-helix transcriptional regulator [Candidatus Woesearchaeota archaeon]HIJ03097.1 winged helix-turn-helix transcriptional regulator [Candidatus Woesearchaeota archaeon]